jgi:HAD superfamily hydrolase (TIGR01490 family)
MAGKTGIQPYVVFDFDGTVLDGHSPVMLVRELFLSRAMPLFTGLAVGLWGLRYKLRLPHDQQIVRQRIFNLFKGHPAAEVDGILERFYYDVIAKRVHEDARHEIASYRKRDIPVIICSASFDPIIKHAAVDLGVTAQISTRMEVVDGCYTGRIADRAVEGEGKRTKFVSYANSMSGEYGWTLLAAYGDHYTDAKLLELAERPVAVNPDNKLKRIARARDWEMREWN